MRNFCNDIFVPMRKYRCKKHYMVDPPKGVADVWNRTLKALADAQSTHQRLQPLRMVFGAGRQQR